MNKKTVSKTIIGTVFLLLTACTHDELTEQGTPLPEGRYPLQIGSITLSGEGGVQTRVTDNGNSSVFENGDVIGVRIGDSEETGEYRLIVGENGQVTGAEPVKPVYWQDTQPAAVTAWYPVDKTIDFTRQDKGLAYLLKASGQASYNAPASLTFAHQLAKVRVTLTGDRTDAVSAVTVRSHVSTENDEGSRGKDSGEVKYVPMLQTSYNGQRCWEATLLKGTLKAADSFRLTPTDGGDPVQATLTGDVPIGAGSLHEITISLVEVIHGDGYTIVPSTHTITLEGASLTSEMISQALDGGETLVINGQVSLSGTDAIDAWVNYGNKITNLTLTDVTSIPAGSIFLYMQALKELDLPNVTNVGTGTFPYGIKLTTLRLTSAETINFASAISIDDAREVTLVLNENKQNEVTNGNQWKNLTWAKIQFE